MRIRERVPEAERVVCEALGTGGELIMETLSTDEWSGRGVVMGQLFQASQLASALFTWHSKFSNESLPFNDIRPRSR